MTVYEMAVRYYPKLWDENKLKLLLQANKLTQEEYEKITQNKV